MAGTADTALTREYAEAVQTLDEEVRKGDPYRIGLAADEVERLKRRLDAKA